MDLVDIKRSSSYNGTADGGCVHLGLVKNCQIKESKFEKCKSVSSDSMAGGGAIRIYPPGGKAVYKIKKCLFVDNSAMKFGGAVFVKKLSSIAEVSVVDSMFINNKATKSGQAILIADYTKEIRNVTIISNSENDADHLYAVGRKINWWVKVGMSVTNVSIRLDDSGYIRNTMRKNMIRL